MDIFFSKLGSGLDQGGPVYLRPLQPQDIDERYLGWFRDERVTCYLESKDISSDEVLTHLVSGFTEDKWYMYAIVEQQSNKHVGNIKLGPINRKHHTADLSIVIGDVDSWGKGYATTAVSLATRIAFEQFGMRKLRAGVIGGNHGSIRAFENAGWTVEAELPFDVLHQGQAKSRFLLGILNPCWRDDGGES
jgi:RimJ/RimL family protein N-acetyltransferase